jgi:hypothetical protein
MTKIERSIMILRRAHHESKDPAHPLWSHILAVIDVAEKHVQENTDRLKSRAAEWNEWVSKKTNIPEENFDIEKSKPIPNAAKKRCPEMQYILKMQPGDSIKVTDQKTCHRLRIYIMRAFGNGASCYRTEQDGFRVWRRK